MRNSARKIFLSLSVLLSSILILVPGTWGFDPAAGDLARGAPGHIRVLTWNTLGNFVDNSSVDAQFERIITAVDPDIISFQETNSSLTEGEIKARLDSYFPGDDWTVHLGAALSGIRNVLASRWTVSLRITDTVPASDARGVTAGLVDLPDGTFGSVDLYVMAVHFKSLGTTSDHMRRQAHADAIVNWMRDARSAGGLVTLASGTPMLLVGDTNLGYLDQGDEAPYHAARTLRDGDIFDEATYGADSPPDWDGTDSDDAAPYDHMNADSHTHSSRTGEPESRLDRMVFTDSVIHVANRFILNTATMSPSALAAAGLAATDTADASDHLPAVADFALGPDPGPPAYLVINEFSYDDTGADDRSFVELKNAGGRDLNLQAPVDYHIVTSNSPLPTSPPGVENQLADYDLQGIVPPGGLFVLYDAAGESAGIASEVEANLPRLQRQDLNVFSLPNGPDIAIALVTVEPIDVLATADAQVDAYMYEDSTPATSNYFRTDSDNGLVIELAPAQSTTLSLISDTESFSRNRDDATRDAFANWTNPDAATPGQENASALGLAGWEIY